MYVYVYAAKDAKQLNEIVKMEFILNIEQNDTTYGNMKNEKYKRKIKGKKSEK